VEEQVQLQILNREFPHRNNRNLQEPLIHRKKTELSLFQLFGELTDRR
jgi:hypothetical protein